MRMTSWVPVSVLLFGALVGLLLHRALVSPSPRTGGPDAGIQDVTSAADIPLAGTVDITDQHDPWLPGVDGKDAAYDPFAAPRPDTRRGPDLETLLRDVGADIRGLGDVSSGIGSLVDLDQVTSGLEDLPSSGHRSNRGSNPPPASALNPSAGAYFNDGLDGALRARFNRQWKGILQDMERSLLPQIATVVFPKNWLDEIHGLAAHADQVANRPTFGEVDVGAQVEAEAAVRTRVERRLREGARAYLTRGRRHLALGEFDLSITAFEAAGSILAAAPPDIDWGALPGDVAEGLRRARYAHRVDHLLGRRRAVEAGLEALTEAEERGLVAELLQLEREQRTPHAPTTWRRASARPNSARLMVGDDTALPLEAMDIAVQIDGHRARVVIDTFFRGDHDRRLHGTWQLRLPTGASPHYLAFGRTSATAAAFTPGTDLAVPSMRARRSDAVEAPKEARMVARVEAARAYHETVHERVDPALMEWAGSGVFSTQVFPLEPGALHHVVVAYDVDLQPDGDDLVHVLDLPQGVPSLDVAITTGETTRLSNPAVARLITRVAATTPVVLAGRSSRAGAIFATRVVPSLPDTPAPTHGRAVFLVDVSASSNPDRFNTWLALLRAVLEENRGSLREFAVAFFHVDVHWWREGFVTNDPATVEALLRDAHGLPLEGATDLGRALAAVDALPGDHDVFLLGDGAATWGETNREDIAARLSPAHPVFGYVLPDGLADPTMLARLASRSGGAVFPLTTEADIPALAIAHAKRPWRLERATIAGTTDLLLAGAPRTLYPGQALQVAGRGVPDANAALVLQVRQGEERRTVRVPLGAPRSSPLAVRGYGEIAVAQLEGLGAAAAATARAYASHFRVVGAGCSLLMLESEADYKARGVRAVDETPIGTQLVSTQVAHHASRAPYRGVDPKARFLARLDGWRAHARFGLVVPPDLRTALAALPPARFALPSDTLAATTRRRADVPADVRAAIASGHLPYDLAAREADRRGAAHGRADALVLLSTLVELSPGDLVLARDVASSAAALGAWPAAAALQQRVVDARPWELPTWLALARSLAQGGRDALAAPYFEAALGGAPDGRFGALARVAALDYRRCLQRLATSGDAGLAAFARGRLPHVESVLALEEADLVVIIEWNTDRTDVDLHVTDPTGEHCYYEHPTTRMGGALSTDVREGLGPEIFVLEHAAAGRYRLAVKYFASDALRTATRSKVRARIIEDYGRSGERARERLILLAAEKQEHVIETLAR